MQVKQSNVPDELYDIPIWQKLLKARFADMRNEPLDRVISYYEDTWHTLLEIENANPDVVDKKMKRKIVNNLKRIYATAYQLEKLDALPKVSETPLDELEDLVFDVQVAVNFELENAKVLIEKGQDELKQFDETHLSTKGLKVRYSILDIEFNITQLRHNLNNGNYQIGTKAQDTLQKTQTLRNKYPEWVRPLELVCNLHKEIGDAHRALKSFEYALEQYDTAISLIGEKSIMPELESDLLFARDIAASWLALSDSPSEAINKLEPYVGKDAANYQDNVQAIPVDIFEAHLVRATAFKNLGDVQALANECELARAIFNGQSENQNQTNLIKRLNTICPHI
jgi:hypothetical protein